MIDSTLLAVLDDLERRPRVAAVRFTDGEVYDLRVISTMHAEGGGDVVAEVVRNVTSRSPNTVPDGAFINFYLADVEQITLECHIRLWPARWIRRVRFCHMGSGSANSGFPVRIRPRFPG